MEMTRSKASKHSLKLFAVTLILIAFATFRYPSLGSSSSSYYSSPENDDSDCDIFSGEWVPNPQAPYYTNETCWAIYEHQNCIKYGRPDSGYMKWRWQPYGCELPVFDPIKFLEMMKGKSIAFVGDSVARNHLQSLICLLLRVEDPVDISTNSDVRFKAWNYVNYNFTIASFWSAFLVKSDLRAADGPTNTGLFNLYLDEPDPEWATRIDDFDYIIISSGHWHTRTAVFHHRRQVVGCHFCQIDNITDFPSVYAYRRAFTTAFHAIEMRKRFTGVTFMRTFSPSHFEGGLWNKGGNCLRRRPYRSNETVLEGINLEFYEAQLEELTAAQRRGKKEFRLMDLTKPMILRPDGHPSRYGHWPNENVTLYNDCVHWCLPGPIDTWADFMIHLLKRETFRNKSPVK